MSAILRPTDRISISRERLISDAKSDVLELTNKPGGYQPPTPPVFRLPGEGGRLAIEQVIDGYLLLKPSANTMRSLPRS